MSDRHERYYSPKPVPCECGSTSAYWHDGPIDGRREYCCDECWKRIQKDFQAWWKRGAK